MTEIEILRNFERAHRTCAKLGLQILPKNEHFEISKNNEVIFKAMKLPPINNWLDGYEYAKGELNDY